ncbi:hypothetical protein [Methylobacterium sp. Leaf106]|uniref:hypothetical protein n=2 Tax=unclassified Methylobacterium TaxID=2615210 RepID=UPI001FCDE289|nr:hypothetical protein [Methylobacterium sp. Leaf106]
MGLSVWPAKSRRSPDHTVQRRDALDCPISQGLSQHADVVAPGTACHAPPTKGSSFMSAILTTWSINLKIGILIAVGVSGGIGALIGYRIGRDFESFMAADRSPTQRALRLVNRVAIEHGLSQGELLKAMLEKYDSSCGSTCVDKK